MNLSDRIALLRATIAAYDRVLAKPTLPANSRAAAETTRAELKRELERLEE